MFLKQKKGSTIVVVIFVLLIVSVIMITYGSVFMAKLIGLFFPNGDKSTLKSFDSVFTVISAKSASLEDYDATTLNIYLRGNYQILVFEDNEVYSVSQTKIPTPKLCEKDKMCVCLYKDMPVLDGKDKNLIKCNNIDHKLTFDSQWQAVNGVIGLTAKPYKSYIFIKYVNYSWSTPKSYLYILEDNEANQAISEELSIPVCKTKDPNDLCFGKKKGDAVEAKDSTSLSKIYNFCQPKDGSKYKALGVLCDYPPTENDCKPDCTSHETTTFCSKYSSCEDFNQLKKDITSSTNIKYMTQEDTENFQQYSLCTMDTNFCDVNNGAGCTADTLKIYACKNSDSGAAEDPNPTDSIDNINTNCLLPSSTTIPELGSANCNVNFLKYSGNKIQIYDRNLQTSFITSYDTSNEKCKAYMTDHFYDTTTLMTCKQGKDAECQKFIAEKNCEIKFIREGNWLTHYSMTDDTCKNKITDLFTTVSLCKSNKQITITASKVQ